MSTPCPESSRQPCAILGALILEANSGPVPCLHNQEYKTISVGDTGQEGSLFSYFFPMFPQSLRSFLLFIHSFQQKSVLSLASSS